MCTLYMNYERFARLLESPDACDNPDFIDFCRKNRLSPDSINEILSDELGLDGNEFFNILRKSQ